ncbi:MAG TPA: Hsp20/alpha crystallin family protein, partial [Acidobacteriota bacterium]|nr:Hsp20/alpha crystallin family protein [Acidobacteriota bacterium]
FEDLFHLQNRMQRLIREKRNCFPADAMVWTPLSDIFETENRFVILLEIPGVRRDEIDLVVEADAIKVKGFKKPYPDAAQEHFHQLGREFGECYRVFRFETPIRPDSVTASIRDGVLTIEVGKQQTRKAVPVDGD